MLHDKAFMRSDIGALLSKNAWDLVPCPIDTDIMTCTRVTNLSITWTTIFIKSPCKVHLEASLSVTIFIINNSPMA